MILKAVQMNLEIFPSDCLLDIGCGNGALSSLIATVPTQLVGVDNSEYLIFIAKEFFEEKLRILFPLHTLSQFTHGRDYCLLDTDAFQASNIVLPIGAATSAETVERICSLLFLIMKHRSDLNG